VRASAKKNTMRRQTDAATQLLSSDQSALYYTLGPSFIYLYSIFLLLWLLLPQGFNSPGGYIRHSHIQMLQLSYPASGKHLTENVKKRSIRYLRKCMPNCEFRNAHLSLRYFSVFSSYFSSGQCQRHDVVWQCISLYALKADGLELQ